MYVQGIRIVLTAEHRWLQYVKPQHNCHTCINCESGSLIYAFALQVTTNHYVQVANHAKGVHKSCYMTQLPDRSLKVVQSKWSLNMLNSV